MASWSYDMLGGMMFVEYNKAGQGRDRLAAQPRLVWGYGVYPSHEARVSS